ncbi:MAG: endonuclease V [Oscillospiraceae bacterium]|nr:endonuclease V [Oscillospiraceae bacterium]
MTQYTQEFMTQVQNEISEKIICQDGFVKEKLKTVAGVDLAYWNQNNQEFAVCCIVILDYQTGKILEKKQFHDKIQVAYQAGFLAFRELPLVLETVKKLEINPDLYIFDGNGYLHPRHAGIASHAGVVLNIPTIGIAKSYYKIFDVDYHEPDFTAGSYQDIMIQQEVYGRVLRTHENVKPIFLSIGHKICLDTATEIAMHFVTKESHIPMPTRLADLETHIARKLILEKS